MHLVEADQSLAALVKNYLLVRLVDGVNGSSAVKNSIEIFLRITQLINAPFSEIYFTDENYHFIQGTGWK